MNTSIEKKSELMTVIIEGRVDANTAPKLEEIIGSNADGVKDLILDMKGMTYISSAGLRILLNTQKKMNKVGSLKLIGVNEDIMEVFEMTGFVDIMDIEG